MNNREHLILDDYHIGYTFKQLHEKYGVSIGYLHKLIHENNKTTRSISEARLAKNLGWRKLVRVGNSSKLVSIPGSLLSKLGLDLGKTLLGRWILCRGKLMLQVKEE